MQVGEVEGLDTSKRQRIICDTDDQKKLLKNHRDVVGPGCQGK